MTPMSVEQMLELFSGDENRTIQDAFRKLHANLKFRAERTVVAISGGSDSDVMLDMVRALEPEKNYPEAKLFYTEGTKSSMTKWENESPGNSICGMKRRIKRGQTQLSEDRH